MKYMGINGQPRAPIPSRSEKTVLENGVFMPLKMQNFLLRGADPPAPPMRGLGHSRGLRPPKFSDYTLSSGP